VLVGALDGLSFAQVPPTILGRYPESAPCPGLSYLEGLSITATVLGQCNCLDRVTLWVGSILSDSLRYFGEIDGLAYRILLGKTDRWDSVELNVIFISLWLLLSFLGTCLA
jgi:hypothetical protein